MIKEISDLKFKNVDDITLENLIEQWKNMNAR
jgi:hypothetical protein